MVCLPPSVCARPARFFLVLICVWPLRLVANCLFLSNSPPRACSGACGKAAAFVQTLPFQEAKSRPERPLSLASWVSANGAAGESALPVSASDGGGREAPRKFPDDGLAEQQATSGGNPAAAEPEISPAPPAVPVFEKNFAPRSGGRRFRLTLTLSNMHTHACVTDKSRQFTFASASSRERGMRTVLGTLFRKNSVTGTTRGGTLRAAAVIGQTVAARALKKGIKEVYFDRKAYKYGGRVAALADAARAEGLDF